MSGAEADHPEERLAGILAAFDDLLAAGKEASTEELEARVDPDLLADWNRLVAFLTLMESAWPRGREEAGLAGPVPEGSGGPRGEDGTAPPAGEAAGQFGRFRIHRTLGQGGFGVVFLAWDPALRRQVALKVPQPEALVTPEARKRFLREAHAAAGLDHPNIVPVYESGSVGTVGYLATAYCPGPTLADWLARQGEPVPVRDAAGLAATLARAVEHAHERGVLHRDLKPSNVLLQPIGSASSPAGPVTGTRAEPAPSSALRAPPPRGGEGDGRRPGDGGGHRGGPAIPLAPRQRGEGARRAGEGSSSAGASAAPSSALRAPSPRGGEGDDNLRRGGECPRGGDEQSPSPQRGEGRAAVVAEADWEGQPLIGFQPRITDFSLAWIADGEGPKTRSGVPFGSPPYMAPEQAEGKLKAIGPPTDVYGLGCILYELLTGHPPFRGETQLGILRQVIADDPIPPRRERKDLPIDLEAIVLKCLEKDPARRYARARDLADDLDRYLAGEPTRARPPRLWGRLGRRARRHPAAAIVLILAVAFSGSLSLGGYWLKVRLDQTRDVARQREDEARRRDLATRRNRYIADIRRAAQLLRGHEGEQAIKLLERNRPGPGEADLRGFAWFHLMRRCHTDRLSLEGHGGEVYHAEFSPDGRIVASSGQDGTVRLSDPATGTLIRSIRAHESEVNWVAFSPDGKSLATTSDDGRVRLFDADTGSRRLDLPAHRGMAVIVRFTPDGRRLISCGREDGNVKVWDAASGRPLTTFHADGRYLENMALSPTGDSVAIASQAQSASLWKVATGERLIDLGPHGGMVLGIGFSRDGTKIVTGSDDRIVRLWESRTGRLLRQYSGHTDKVQTVALAPDDRTLISAGDDATVRLWDMATGEPRGVHLGHINRVWGVSPSPDGRTIASASRDGTVKLWDPRPFETPTRLVAGDVIKALTFSADGRSLVAAGSGGQVWTWDAEAGILRGSRRLGHADGPAEVALNRDGSLAAVCSRDGSIEIHDLIHGRSLKTIGPIPGGVCAMAFGPEGRRLAVVAWGQSAMIWDPAGAGPEAILRGDIVRAVFAPDGDLLCSAGRDGDLIVWNPVNGRTKVHSRVAWWPERSSCLSPDGTLLAMGGDPTVALRALDSPGRPQENLEGHADRVLALDFSPHGETLASGDRGGAVKLWDVSAREDLLTLGLHAGPVRGIRFSSDGRALASCADQSDGNSEIFLWRAARDDREQAAPHPDRSGNQAR